MYLSKGIQVMNQRFIRLEFKTTYTSTVTLCHVDVFFPVLSCQIDAMKTVPDRNIAVCVVNDTALSCKGCFSSGKGRSFLTTLESFFAGFKASFLVL
jgi:hypothetical protein